MGCEHVRIGGFDMIVCSRGRKTQRCDVPKCGKPAVALCDHPVTRKGRAATCDRPMCRDHRYPVAGVDNQDYCIFHHGQGCAQHVVQEQSHESL